MATAAETFSEIHFYDIMKNLSWFHEENRYRNWYTGLTEISMPRYEYSVGQSGKYKHLYYYIATRATTGKIWTANYGEQMTDNSTLDAMIFNIGFMLPMMPALR